MRALTKAGVVLGLGLGGFLDGIVLHQILGWHHLICVSATCGGETVAELKRQNVEDGFFHLAVWLLTAGGVVLLFRAARSSAAQWRGRELVGSMLAGWGIFNLVEGLIDHQLLGLHHVRPGHPQQFAWDMGFLCFGLLLAGLGAWLAHAGRTQPEGLADAPSERDA